MRKVNVGGRTIIVETKNHVTKAVADANKYFTNDVKKDFTSSSNVVKCMTEEKQLHNATKKERRDWNGFRTKRLRRRAAGLKVRLKTRHVQVNWNERKQYTKEEREVLEMRYGVVMLDRPGSKWTVYLKSPLVMAVYYCCDGG